MSAAALRRTVCGCTALLIVPLSLLVLVSIAWLQEDSVTLSHPVLAFRDVIAMLVLVAALAYLAGSVVYQFAARIEDAPERDTDGDVPRN